MDKQHSSIFFTKKTACYVVVGLIGIVTMYLIQAIKKQCSPQKGYCEKDVKSKVQPRNGCDGRLMVKIFT